ncbi:hypothetical protein APHAL10511_001894 [Amanita phalloides]|nr:hypothetical protein APHAL10511_001894 [Amanita phalloides]
MVKASTQTSPNLSPFKRRKSEDDEANASVSKKQRTRVSFSCGECHRRKQKCDRQIPCSHCTTRKVPDLCKPYTPGKADQDMNVRITRLEHIVQAALPHYWSSNSSMALQAAAADRKSSPSIGDDDNGSITEDHDPMGGTFQSGKWYGNSVSGSVAPGSVLEQLKCVAGPLPSNSKQIDSPRMPGHDHDTNNFDLAQTSSAQRFGTPGLEAVENDTESSTVDNFHAMLRESGFSPQKIAELLQELPPPRICDDLVDFYFSTINWTRYPISEPDFRAAYMSLCANVRDGLLLTTSSQVRFLPLLFVTLAISARLITGRITSDALNIRNSSLQYYWSSRRALLMAAAIQPDSLDIVLTRLLSARFLTFDRRITECWSQLGAAVRTAQALGLHRDGTTMELEPSVVEYRRRIWSYLYHADRSYALVLGRPNSIQDDYTSTQPPSNIDDAPSASHISDYPPLSSPTPMTFVILRHQLATIMGRIVHHFQRVREKSHYSEVTVLDDELHSFVSNLPPHFALNPDKSLDETFKYIPVHRYLLLTEVMFVRINLHRPYFLRRLNSDRYTRSRQACFDSAVKDFKIRQAFREVMPREARDSHSNAYRDFQAAMISGIYFMLEPNGKYAAVMHAILDGFMKDHQDIRDMDKTTRRELKIIEFLQKKASQIELQRSVTTNQASEQQAQLLLGLQQNISTTNPQRPNSSALTASPTLTYPSHVTQSPTLSRLHHSSEHAQSPTTTASPGTVDDDMGAQSLLDHWCNTVSNAPIDASTGAMSWGGPSGADISGWVQALNVNGADLRLLSGSEDWNYWEALSINRFLYGPTPEERVRAWQTKLRAESRQLDREMRQLDMATAKARQSVKQLASKGDIKSARILAKEVVRSAKQKDRLSVSKARLGSIGMQLSHQLAMTKVTGSLQKSTEIMKLSNVLIRLPQLSQTMRQMSMEMTKAGVMEEMLEDTLQMDEDEELEAEADEEVEKVLFELTDGKLGQAGKVDSGLPALETGVESEEAERVEQFRQQLHGLLSS